MNKRGSAGARVRRRGRDTPSPTAPHIQRGRRRSSSGVRRARNGRGRCATQSTIAAGARQRMIVDRGPDVDLGGVRLEEIVIGAAADSSRAIGVGRTCRAKVRRGPRRASACGSARSDCRASGGRARRRRECSHRRARNGEMAGHPLKRALEKRRSAAGSGVQRRRRLDEPTFGRRFPALP